MTMVENIIGAFTIKKLIAIIVFIVIVVVIVAIIVVNVQHTKQVIMYKTVDELMASNSIQTALKSPKYGLFTSSNYMNKGIYQQFGFGCIETVDKVSCTYDNFDKAAEKCLNSPYCIAIYVKQNENGEISYALSATTELRTEPGPLLLLRRGWW